jgi:cytosine/adenosine deaminase-related metal-dependent hydrolase
VTDAVLATLRASVSDPERRILIRGSAILSMDPAIGDLASGDILIDGDTITQVGPDLSPAAADGRAITVDGRGYVAIPGLQDTHRHCWQTTFRRLLPDGNIRDYLDIILGRIGPVFRPQDMYVATLIAGLGALEAGVTTVLDFAHNNRSPDHSDASVDAWVATGLRAVHASGAGRGHCADHWPADLRRMRAAMSSVGRGRVTLRLALTAPAHPKHNTKPLVSEEHLAFARELGLAVSIDGVQGAQASAHIEALGARGVLGPDITYIHCQALTDDCWRFIADSGGEVSLAPLSDVLLGQFDGMPPVQQALDWGLRPSLGVDAECSLTTDLFSAMQVTLTVQRLLANQRRWHGDADAPEPLTARRVLEFATVNGARANAVLDIAGTLTPGKRADLVMIDAAGFGSMPLNSAVGTVVLGDTSRVAHVFVAGDVLKWDGRVLGHDRRRIERLVTDSRDYLIERGGVPLEIAA